MAIHFNPTMNQFVNWANQDGIGKEARRGKNSQDDFAPRNIEITE